MQEFKHGNATVRIHNTVNHERLVEATTKFLKQVEAHRRKLRNAKAAK